MKNTFEIMELVKKMNELGFKVEFGKKNANGVKYNTLIIGEGNIRPVFTIDADLIDEIRNVGVEAVAKRIVRTLDNDSDAPAINPKEIASADYFRKNAFFAVGNKAMAEDETIVGYVQNDVFYYIRVNAGNGSFVVKKGMLAALQLNEDELFEIAKAHQIERANTPEDLSNFLTSMGVPVAVGDVDAPGMFIVTTSNKYCGASLAFVPEYMNKLLLSMNLKKVFVLPSSIHECLIVTNVPENDDEVTQLLAELSKMVGMVNVSSVNDCEVLADHAYLYTVGEGFVA